MIESVLSAIINWVINVIDASGYFGVGVLMAIESAAIPIPSEIIMPFSGSLVSSGRFTLFGLALAGAFGSMVGSIFIYVLARVGGRPLILNYGKYIFISVKDIDLSDRFFARYGGWASFIGRVLPVIRTYISIPAGISRTAFIPFAITSFVGSFIWSYFLAYVGYLLGAHWETLHERFKILPYSIAALIALAFIIHIVRQHRRVDKTPKI